MSAGDNQNTGSGNVDIREAKGPTEARLRALRPRSSPLAGEVAPVPVLGRAGSGRHNSLSLIKARVTHTICLIAAEFVTRCVTGIRPVHRYACCIAPHC